MTVWISYKVHHALYHVPPVPNIPLDQYWGPGDSPETHETSIREYRITFKPEVVKDLLNRLENTNFYTEPLEGVSFQDGFNNNYLKEVIEFWKTKYNFNERENYLNKYPHFKTKIQGLDIHYMHVKPKVTKNIRVLPLLLLHGWPGSVKEFYGMIPLLTTPRKDYDFVFELIIPSLPGFGYSQGSSRPGLGPTEMAVVMRNLMERIGFDKYYIQGGDWGAVITSNMAVLYPDKILGYHTNNPNSATMLRIALKDSPAGLAAYIIEKFLIWTNRSWVELNDGGLIQLYTLTDLLDNVMIYWTSGCITTSVRPFSEIFKTFPADIEK
ncbi:juvenile hormone epoxide hydrolase 1-like [Arctopsyche grandis]|uniref:juvenile hormone epoxide hydrolase 1-like n=1 Tax=Arctopsyche grandis TaxID=121162 RepID=UPI00406D763E